jgi:hypothetical protein
MNCCISQEVALLHHDLEAPACCKMLRALYFLGCYDQNGFELVWGIRHSLGARQDETTQLNRVSIVGKFLRKQGCYTLGSLVDMYITTRTPSKQIPGILKIGASRCLFWLPKGTGPAILTEGGKSWYDCLHIQSRYPILLLSECVLVADLARKGNRGSSGKCGFLWCFGASRRYLAVVFLQSAYIGHQQIHERNKESTCQVTFLCSWEEENKLNISIPLCTLYLHIVRWMQVL